LDFSRIRVNNSELIIQDASGGFDAVQYDTDPSTGTLELTNAKLSISNPPDNTYFINMDDVNGLAQIVPADSPNLDNKFSPDSPVLRLRDNSGFDDSYLHTDGGELIGTDDVGNSTTLT
jgi:hypothetical protein